MNIRVISAAILITFVATSCNQYYKDEDFASVKKVDTHMHLNTSNTAVSELAREDNFRLVTVNVDAPSNPSLEDQQQFALEQIAAFPNDVNYLTSFTLKDWGTPGWKDTTIAYLRNSFDKGALGIKIWKNIGMIYKDSADQFIMIDNPVFDPVIEYVIKQDKTILGHLGEPKNCWLPLEKMTVNNDRLYFKNHPQYHMFLHPEDPSYDDQIAARDRFLERHPDLRFVGAHLGSLEWDVDELAKRLDKFPNMAVDMGARICHLQYQSKANREKVRNFIIKYADRLTYGTDIGVNDSEDPGQAKDQQHKTWLSDWTYFVTDKKMSVAEVDGEFDGLKLPRDVVDKIYHDTAVKWFKIPDVTAN
ncbi:MAG: amidohydrolase family protein [Chryseolinea sp.]